MGYFTTSQFVPVLFEAMLPYVQRKLKTLSMKVRFQKPKDRSDSVAEFAQLDESEANLDVVITTTTHPLASASSPERTEQWLIDVQRIIHGRDSNPNGLAEKDEKQAKDDAKFAARVASGMFWQKMRLESKLIQFQLIDDYEDLVLEFGYVLAFTVLWPLIPFLALLNNLLEARMDFFRLCKGSQRPIPYAAKGIGVYETHLRATTHASVVMTLGLCLIATHNMDFYFDFWQGTAYEEVLFYEDELTQSKHLTIGVRFLIAVLVEHILILIQSGVENIIPAEAEWVRKERLTSKANMTRIIHKEIKEN
jgi:hypothetical protein